MADTCRTNGGAVIVG